MKKHFLCLLMLLAPMCLMATDYNFDITTDTVNQNVNDGDTVTITGSYTGEKTIEISPAGFGGAITFTLVLDSVYLDSGNSAAFQIPYSMRTANVNVVLKGVNTLKSALGVALKNSKGEIAISCNTDSGDSLIAGSQIMGPVTVNSGTIHLLPYSESSLASTSIGDSDSSLLIKSGANLLLEGDDIGAGLLGNAITVEKGANVLVKKTTIATSQVKTGEDNVYQATIPGLVTASQSYQFDIKKAGSLGTYVSYVGKGFYDITAGSQKDIGLFLPNGSYTLSHGGKTYGCLVNDAPGTFEAVPEPAFLGLLGIMGLMAFRRRN